MTQILRANVPGRTAPPMPGLEVRRARLLSLPLLVASYGYLVALYRGGILDVALADGDTYWHIAAGRWIIEHRAIPFADPFSHSMSGMPWTAHEWLAEVLLALVYSALGWAGVVALTGLCFAAALGLLARGLLPWFSPTRVLLLAAVAVMMSVTHVLVRPHVLAMPLMVAWTLALVRAADAQRAPSLWVVPLMTLWANVHGGFTLGLALALAFAGEAALAAWQRGNLVPAMRGWALFLAASAAAAVLTPHGLSGIIFTWELMFAAPYALSRIVEWASPDFQQFQPLMVWLLGGMALVLYQGLRLPAVRLLLVLGVLYLALKHSRNGELLGLLVPLFVARPFGLQWQQRQAHAPEDAVQRWLARRVAPARLKALLFWLLLMALPTVTLQGLRPIEPPARAAPAGLLDAARMAGVKGRVLNDYNWGGWLIFSGLPVFIDGRADVYGDALFRPYVNALEQRSPGELEALLAKHRIDWTLLKAGTPALDVLDRLPGWRRVHADAQGVIHARVADASATLAPGSRP